MLAKMAGKISYTLDKLQYDATLDEGQEVWLQFPSTENVPPKITGSKRKLMHLRPYYLGVVIDVDADMEQWSWQSGHLDGCDMASEHSACSWACNTRFPYPTPRIALHSPAHTQAAAEADTHNRLRSILRTQSHGQSQKVPCAETAEVC